MKIPSRSNSRSRSTALASETGRNDTYDCLLTVTAQLMTEKDSIEFSLSEVAVKSGMSAALVQYHFGSKDGLLMALLERGTSKAVEQLAALEKMPLSADERLRMHVKGLVTAYVRAPYINRLLHHMMNSGNEARALHISNIFIAPIAAFQRKLIEQGVAEGTFRWVDPMHFYFMLVGACDHLVARRGALQHAFGVSRLTDELSQSYSETLYRMIRAGMAADPQVRGVQENQAAR